MREREVRTLPAPRLQAARTWAVVLPLFLLGTAAWVPPLWAAWHRRGDRRQVRLLLGLAAGLAVLGVVGVALLLSAPRDADGYRTGPLVAGGLGCLGLAALVGTVVGWRVRNAEVDALERARGQHPPQVQAELDRRAARRRARELAERDPAQARAAGVGRPDLARTVDDGGLLDLNALDAEALVAHGGLDPATAERVVAGRPYALWSEVEARAGLDRATARELQGRAVLL
jgi:DNA uptake protein ComE-like DNA-binding protein